MRHRIVCHSTGSRRRRAPCATLRPSAKCTTGSCVPCAMKIGTSRLAGAGFRGERVRSDQVGRQRDDSRQPLAMPQAGIERDRAALRESRRARCASPRCRARLRARSVPRRAPASVARPRGPRALLKSFSRMSYHARIAIAVVDRHRHHRRVRKQEAHGERSAAAAARARFRTSRGRRRRAHAARSRRHRDPAPSRFRSRAAAAVVMVTFGYRAAHFTGGTALLRLRAEADARISRKQRKIRATLREGDTIAVP